VIAQKPKILLLTPPPVNEYQLTIRDALKGCTMPQRTAANTKKYADACRQVGEELGLPVVDLWRAFMSKAGWEEGEPLIGSGDRERNRILESLLQDGICHIDHHTTKSDNASRSAFQS
jgi:isoamyl acetate esterase